MQIKTACFVAGLIFCLGSPAGASEKEDEPDYVSDTLSGAWGGLRSEWSERGIDVDIGFKSDMLWNVRGGLRQGGRPINQFDVKLAVDFEKYAGLHGLSGYVNFIYDSGGKINRDYVGSLMGVCNAEVTVSTQRFFHAWIEQAFLNKQWAILVGLYPIDSEFQVLESAGLFLQPTYGATADLALTRGPSIFNQSAFGVRAKWVSDKQPIYAMAAILDGIPGDPDQAQGTHIKFNKGDGTMHIAEIGLTPRPEHDSNSSQKSAESAKRPWSEKYSFGYWGYTSRVDDLIDVDVNGQALRRNSSGWYAQAERTAITWADGELVAFARHSKTDGDSTAIRDVSSIGARMRGVIPGRGDDFLGIAYTRGSISNKWRESQALAAVSTVGAESAIEIAYRIQATPWLVVQPMYQYIQSPGAISTVPDATLLGVKVELAL
jgi:porin